MNLSTEQRNYLAAQYQLYRKSQHYDERKEQSRFCNFAREFIKCLVEEDLFNKDSATMLVHTFAVRARKDTIVSYVESVVKDDIEKRKLLALLDECPLYGFTAVGKTNVELTTKQASIVKAFLSDILKSNSTEQIKRCVEDFVSKGVPNCTTGIFSPWLHYIHPTLCPIANSAIEPYLCYLGEPKSKRSNYLYMIDLLNETKEACGAEDFSMLDNFLFYFDEDTTFEERTPRYWVFNHKFDGASEQEQLDLRLQAIANNYAFMQYEYGHQNKSSVTINWNSAIQVREGDYLFLKSDRVYAVGRAVRPRKESTLELSASDIIRKKEHGKFLSGKCKELITFSDAEVFYEDLLDGEANGWGQRIDVDSWKYYNPAGIWVNTDNYVGGTVYDTIREISEDEGKRLINQLNKGLGMKMDVLKQLERCYNLVLTGAPGTGKTYMAKQVARLMLFGKAQADELNEEEKEIYKQHVEFVQFHPSYDYSDFVEGLRPVQSGDGNQLGFERKNGVFKAFCERAILDAESSTDNFDEAWEALVAELDEKDYIDVQLLSKKGTFKVELNEYGTGLANRTYPNNQYEKGQWIEGKSKFFSKDQLRNIYHGVNGVPGRGHDNYRRAIVEHMKKYFGLKDYVNGSRRQEKHLPYILIIDEINRGEINKILGELFYSIDPGYRGESGRVKTQYQNMISEDDIFYQGFYVPENVYILGTMNDIDRSVESMDFAIRRRFTWREISAKDTQKDMLSLLDDSIRQEVINRMDSLNAAILDSEYHLGNAYQIGASYFLKLREDPSLENLWRFHLKGVIYEYLRGQRDVEEKIGKLCKAFGCEPENV